MSRNLLKNLAKRFRGGGFGLFSLVVLNNYLSFLIHFNLRINLSTFGNSVGQFSFLFSRFTFTGSEEVIWLKLLTILFLVYFPVKLMTQLILDFSQRYYERKITTYLNKSLLALAVQNKALEVARENEKLNIIVNSVPDFSRQLFYLFLNFTDIIIGIILELFSLFFLLITRNLLDLVSWIFGFNFLTLISLALFRFCFTKSIRKSQQESWDYQQEEKKQIRNFLASLKWDVSTSNYEKMATWLDNNSPRLFLSFFHSVIFRLPNLIIPGLAILFLFLYANFYKPGAHIDWNLYLVAFHCQNVFWKIGRLFDLFSSENSFRRNYFLIQKELDLLNAKS